MPWGLSRRGHSRPRRAGEKAVSPVSGVSAGYGLSSQARAFPYSASRRLHAFSAWGSL
jgi:hypothetical protein